MFTLLMLILTHRHQMAAAPIPAAPLAANDAGDIVVALAA